MSRNLLAIAGILICSANVLGQDFVPRNDNPFQTKQTSFAPPTNSFTPVQQKVEPPAPDVNPNQATIQPVPVKQEPTIILPAKKTEIILPAKKPETVLPNNQVDETIVELPSPKAEIKPIELKEDNQQYKSTGHNNIYGVSDYRIEVAREKARARRLRMEAKKWYGIDSARPTVAPRVHLPTYSAYYNGVFSRHGYPYNYGANFYFHVPVNR